MSVCFGSGRSLQCAHSEDGGSSATIVARIAAANVAFHKLHSIFAMRCLNRALKVKLFLSHILPVLLYGSECWAPSGKDKTSLEGFLGSCLLRMEGITSVDHVPYSERRARYNIYPLEYYLRLQRLRWLGHLHRMPANLTTTIYRTKSLLSL